MNLTDITNDIAEKVDRNKYFKELIEIEWLTNVGLDLCSMSESLDEQKTKHQDEIETAQNAGFHNCWKQVDDEIKRMLRDEDGELNKETILILKILRKEISRMEYAE